MPLIACRDASFAYEGKTVVEGLNFEINTGEYLCIAGENGSGKSTLLKGLLKLKPTSRGQVVSGDGLRANEVGYLPQQDAAQKDFPASAYEVVLSGRLNKCGMRPFYSKNDKKEAARHMERLGVWDKRGCCYPELSGGQQRRVLLARALCAANKLLILDEPASGLDPVSSREMYECISEINRESGLAVIMVTHDIRGAVHYAGLILHMDKTQLFFGTAAEYAQSAVGQRFLGG